MEGFKGFRKIRERLGTFPVLVRFRAISSVFECFEKLRKIWNLKVHGLGEFRRVSEGLGEFGRVKESLRKFRSDLVHF